MELKLYVFIVISQILNSVVFGEITLPFTDFVATVTPVKPNSTLLSNGECLLPSLPKDTNLSEYVLEYFKSQFPELVKKSPIVCTFSSPLVVTSYSRPIPISKSKNNDEDFPNLSVLPDNQDENDILISNTPSARTLPIIPFTIRIPTTPQYPPVEYDLYQNEVPLCPQMCETYASQISSSVPEITIPLNDDTLSLNVLEREYLNQPIANPNNFVLIPTSSNNCPSYSSPTDPESLYPSILPTEPLYPLPYPLQYTHLPSSEGITASDIESPEPNPYQEKDAYILQQFDSENFANGYTRPLFIALRNLPSMTTQTYPCKTADRSYTVKLKTPPTDLLTDDICNCPNSMTSWENPISPVRDPFYVEAAEIDQVPCDEPTVQDFKRTLNLIKNLNIDFEDLSNGVVPDILPSLDDFVNTLNYNLKNNILNSQANIKTYSTVPEFFNNVPEIPTVPEICVDIVPDEYLGPVVSNLFDTCNSRMETPTNINSPSSYPSYDTSDILASAINNTILDIAKSISSHFMSYLNAKTGKKNSDPYAAIQFKSDVNPKPVPSCIEINPTIPKTITQAPCKNLNIQNNIPNLISPEYMVPISSLSTSPTDFTPCDDKFSLLNVISSVVSKSPDLPINIMDISPPKSMEGSKFPPLVPYDSSISQQCPNSLPTGVNPSNIEISFPEEWKTQVTKLKSLKNKPKTFKKFLELIFLAELLNDDEDIDWEAIDAVLELLSITL